jgi:phenylalanyl-tRNA synthetase beta chain
VMKNPLSEEHAALRSHMLPSGLEVIAHNRNRRQQDLRFFELGKTYAVSENGYAETLKLCVWFAGDRRPLHWKEKNAAADIFTMTSIAEWIISSLGSSIQPEAMEDAEFDFGNALLQGKQQVGRYGKVSSALCAQYDVSIPVYYLEMDWKAIYKTAGKKSPVYQELPKFPAVRRDLSLVIPEGMRWLDMQRVILKADPALVRQAELFDVFKSADGKRSYSVAITLQDLGNTLQDARIEQCMEKITLKLAETCGATVRA